MVEGIVDKTGKTIYGLSGTPEVAVIRVKATTEFVILATRAVPETGSGPESLPAELQDEVKPSTLYVHVADVSQIYSGCSRRLSEKHRVSIGLLESCCI